MDGERFSGYRNFEENIYGGSIISDLGKDVENIFKTKTDFKASKIIPNLDSGLTFQRNNDRNGIEIRTCVLFVDIRNSVKMNDEHKKQTVARIYSSFIYGVLKIAKEWGGHVRNIIGDRVMVVFDEKNCCYNAVSCAAMIMTFTKNVMAKVISSGAFDCGIGIHYGIMDVVKVGLTVQGQENKDYQNLVWIGEPANLASRLTDVAAKDIKGIKTPHILISGDVRDGIKDFDYYKQFQYVDNRLFRNIVLKVYGCNLYIE